MRSYVSILLFIFFVSAFVFMPCCKKEDRIPYVYVNYQLYLNNPELIDLQTAGNYVYITGGVKGIIIYTVYPGEYNAFERNCSYNPYDKDAFVKVDSTGTLMVCKGCQSQFMLLDGTVVKGPATRALLQYQTTVQNDILHIFNDYYY